MIERTLIILKPDTVLRSNIGNVISRIEAKGLKISALKMESISSEKAGTHYAEHKGKPFYESLISYITSCPVVLGVIEGEDAITVIRSLCGATDPHKAAPGSIRGDFGFKKGNDIFNVIHASDSPDSAKREISLFFKEQ
jgi:nucleoside-diphosphate kinase